MVRILTDRIPGLKVDDNRCLVNQVCRPLELTEVMKERPIQGKKGFKGYQRPI